MQYINGNLDASAKKEYMPHKMDDG